MGELVSLVARHTEAGEPSCEIRGPMTTITISGLPGTGKTTVAKMLEHRLGLKYVYSGEIFRRLAKKYKMSLEEFGVYCEHHREIDEELDTYQLALLRKGNVIVEGRIAGWLAYRNHIPGVKILLDASLDVRAKRVVNRELGDINKRKQEIVKRERSEATRYQTYYGIDVRDSSIYDLVIDTGDKPPEAIVDIIMRYLGK
jgi:predicted cytidylate kinase